VIEDIPGKCVGREKWESQYTNKKYQKSDDQCHREWESDIARDIADGVAEYMHERFEKWISIPPW
jgi:cobalamin-dependent methionine synthase I